MTTKSSKPKLYWAKVGNTYCTVIKKDNIYYLNNSPIEVVKATSYKDIYEILLDYTEGAASDTILTFLKHNIKNNRK